MTPDQSDTARICDAGVYPYLLGRLFDYVPTDEVERVLAECEGWKRRSFRATQGVGRG